MEDGGGDETTSYVSILFCIYGIIIIQATIYWSLHLHYAFDMHHYIAFSPQLPTLHYWDKKPPGNLVQCSITNNYE